MLQYLVNMAMTYLESPALKDDVMHCDPDYVRIFQDISCNRWLQPA